MSFGAVKFIKNSDVCLISDFISQGPKELFGFEVMLTEIYFCYFYFSFKPCLH